jgi:hypothetical protein
MSVTGAHLWKYFSHVDFNIKLRFRHQKIRSKLKESSNEKQAFEKSISTSIEISLSQFIYYAI